MRLSVLIIEPAASLLDFVRVPRGNSQMLQCTSAVRYRGTFNTLNPSRAAFLLAFDGKVSVRKDFTCDCEQRAQRLGLRICVSHSSHLIVPSSYSACSQFRYSSHEKKSFTKCDSNVSLVYGLHTYTAIRSRPKRYSMCTSMRIAASGVPKYFSRLVNVIRPIFGTDSA